MTKKLSSFLVLCMAFISLASLKKEPSASIAKPVIKTLIIDAGHGGRAVGALGLKTSESQITLGVALKLGKIIQKEFPDIKIVYTRTTDVDCGNATTPGAGNRNRAKMANEARGDLFISLHCNSTRQRAGGYNAKRIVSYKTRVVYTGKGKRRKSKTIQVPVYETYYVENKVKGTETYIWAADRGAPKSEAVPPEENSEDLGDSLDVFELNSPEARIRAQLYTKSYFRNSLNLATYIEESFGAGGRASHGGVKQRNDVGIWVLQATGMPSVLVEMGFITNREEEEYMMSADGQNEIAESITEAFKRYKQEIESGPKQSSQVNNSKPVDASIKR